MKILNDLDLIELKELLADFGEKEFRAKQIFYGLSQGLDIDELTTISKKFRAELSNFFEKKPVQIERRLISKDGTEKYLFKLFDGNIVEGVYMKNNYGNTMCLSTQVGCRMGCKFCASTIGGLVRNLSAGEILGMFAKVNRLNGGKKDNRAIANIVLMGSGEPLDNYDNVIKFLRLISSPDGLNISPRNISLSTSGLAPKIYTLADEGLSINLTISLHNPFDEGRKQIMPVANSYTIEEILKGCDYYFSKTSRRYIFEYCLIKGQNDSEECLKELAKILRGRPCHVNIIRLNEVKEAKLKAVDTKNAYEFADKLTKLGISATVRRLNGADINGACGQLRRSYIGGEND